ncbi:MAG: RNA polymerase sigma factor region1.1 domain-containing protein, partial [Nannocystaceae bacterium]
MQRKTPTRTVDAEKLKKNLIAYGKKKGHITYEELQELLPPDLIDPAEFDQWESMLVAEGVPIIAKDEAKVATAKTQTKVATRKVMPKRYEREDEEDEQARTNDPVRMYLRKMGSVSLLTREGEVEIA